MMWIKRWLRDWLGVDGVDWEAMEDQRKVLQHQYERLEARLTGLQDERKSFEYALDRQVDNLEDRIDEIDPMIETIGESIDTLDSSLEAMRNDTVRCFDGLTKRVW